MKNPVFTGAAVAIITPMYEDGSINFDELGRIIEDQIARGTDAIVICGTTGECSTINFTVETVNPPVPVIAAPCSNDTDHGCALAAKSAACGADALLLVTPYYNKTTQAGLVAHFTAMAEAGGVKVLIPHHMDLAMSEDMYLPRIEEMERAVHARVPGCTVITPERLKWYHMGLSVWA
mgnify:CR=1 FL=1